MNLSVNLQPKRKANAAPLPKLDKRGGHLMMISLSLSLILFMTMVEWCEKSATRLIFSLSRGTNAWRKR
ncbi:hypothetical protein QEO94_09415 [Kingella negevensis]|nr:hypothetical protein [Kingella negevensis]WII92840.1 hypothetical protein QEO94_09415 [Kingella negevensis]